jgi:hypothetical protein
MAVAIWDHLPTADELLERRVTMGWRPLTSPLKEGDVVLGHAACLIKARE